jgi:Zn-dependent alcohol dehydrogenase
VFSFLPSCGRCRWCATGHQNLCDLGASIEEGTAIGRELTGGQGADAAIVTVGVTTGAHVGAALRAVRKAGTCVVVGLGETRSRDGDIPLTELVL